MKRLSIALLLLASLSLHAQSTPPPAPPTAAGAPLTNASIIEMAKMGLAAQVIVAVIHSKAGNYDVTQPALKILTADRVPADVIAAMIATPKIAPAKSNFFGQQISPRLIESKPVHINGQTIQMIKAPGVHILAFLAGSNPHYGFEQIEILIRNTSDQAIDFDPETQLTAYSATSPNLLEYPLDSSHVEIIASKIKRKQSLGIFAASVLGAMAAGSYSQYSTTNTYEQARSDNATDAASDASQEQFASAIKTQFLESTLAPNQLAGGWVYFRIPKKTKKPTNDFVPDYVEATVNGVSYRLLMN